MSADFVQRYGGRRLTPYAPPQPLFDVPEETEESSEAVPGRVLDFELPEGQWAPRPLRVPAGWQVATWTERPRRFIDGKDAGQTVAWLRAPGGHPIPVRLSEIGGVAVRVRDGVCRREAYTVERVVSMIVDPFPWDEVEGFASALHERGFRLLPAEKPDGRLSFDFEQMRKAAQNRSNTEMGVLEEAVLAQASDLPTVVDGRLEPRVGGLHAGGTPAIGVIKTHAKNYLHALGMQVLYDLAPGERTPIFLLQEEKLPVATWYLRLTGAAGSMPNWGVVRVELPLQWVEGRSMAATLEYVDRLSLVLMEYRSRDGSYGRQPVSLHPIVRAEELLGALFSPGGLLANRFYRASGF